MMQHVNIIDLQLLTLNTDIISLFKMLNCTMGWDCIVYVEIREVEGGNKGAWENLPLPTDNIRRTGWGALPSDSDASLHIVRGFFRDSPGSRINAYVAMAFPRTLFYTVEHVN